MFVKLCLLLAFVAAVLSARIRDEVTGSILQIGLKTHYPFGKNNITAAFLHARNALKKKGDVIFQPTGMNFYAPMSIGTPKQEFNMAFDINYGDMWIPNPQYCDFEPEFCQSHPTYDSSKSSTYKSVNTTFTIEYLTNTLTGYTSKDTVNIGGLSVTNQAFGEVTKLVTASNFAQRVDGYLGLGFKSASQFKVDPPFVNMIKQKLVNQPVYSIYVDKTFMGGAELTLGGVNKTHFKGSWSYAPVLTNKHAWQLNVDSLNFKGKSLTTSNVATLYPGYEFIFGPQDAFDTINKAIGGFSFEGVYIVDCNKVSTFPNIQFVINKKVYALKGEDYIYNESGVCYSGLLGDQGQGTDIVLGNMFLRRYYTQYDMGKKRVGFATAK